MNILVTGCAGFIGFHLAKRLLSLNHTVIGIDNLNDYYDVELKKNRLAQLTQQNHFTFYKLDITDNTTFTQQLSKANIAVVYHLAAQAGVRYSLENPNAYIQANLTGFGNILEFCRVNSIAHLIFASSSSVYGANTRLPFQESDNVDHPVSLYAATKKSNELMAHSYSHLYKLPCTGVRFFTVYGPWGRPDMALFKFVKAITENKTIEVYNNGDMLRDLTYVDDVVDGLISMLSNIAKSDPSWDGNAPNPATSYAPYRIYNLGNNSPVSLSDFIGIIEDCLKKKAKKQLLPLQPGDVTSTHASISRAKNDLGYIPKTSLADGIKQFTLWYNEYYQS